MKHVFSSKKIVTDHIAASAPVTTISIVRKIFLSLNRRKPERRRKMKKYGVFNTVIKAGASFVAGFVAGRVYKRYFQKKYGTVQVPPEEKGS